jgi:hypothetical protein
VKQNIQGVNLENSNESAAMYFGYYFTVAQLLAHVQRLFTTSLIQNPYIYPQKNVDLYKLFIKKIKYYINDEKKTLDDKKNL